MKWTDVTVDGMRKMFADHGYTVLSRPYEINIFGVRTAGGFTNTFNDVIGAVWVDFGGTPYAMGLPGTTDPGKYWLENPMNVKGTAILKPGQHSNSHKKGLHKGEYPALVQNKPLPVWRDADKDDVYEYTASDSGIFGINIHRANPSKESTQVDKWSAGCQVVASPTDFKSLMDLVEMHIAQGYGDVFTYTLFEEAAVPADHT